MSGEPSHLDGNAVAGALLDAFGAEMTAATCVCSNCGACFLAAESDVYLRAPGIVVRCRGCGSVLMVLVVRGGLTCVDRRGLAVFELDPS